MHNGEWNSSIMDKNGRWWMKIRCSWMNFIHDDVGNGDGDVMHDIGGGH
jgi:hypothetical protein